MSNELPDTFSALTTLAEDMIDGLTDHGSTVGEPPNEGVKQWTVAALQGRLDAAQAARRSFQEAGRAEAAVETARKIANSNAKGFLATARRMLLDDLGSTPSRVWEDAGWPAGTTAAPDTLPGRLRLLEGLTPWLQLHPEKEIPQKGFTAAKGGEIREALKSALRDLPDKVRDRATAAATFAAAERALRTGMSGLAAELDSILSDDSPDWYYFGLVPPAKAEPPAPPEQIEARLVAPGAVLLACDRSPRGQKYRFAIKVDGRDADWLEQELVTDPELLVEDLPTTGTLRARVQSRNAAGNSPWTLETTLSLA